jgi:hypothetical protein
MRLLPPRFRRDATFAAALYAITAAQAAPPAPAGWTTQSDGDVQIYKLEHDGHHAELRLFPVEAGPASFDDWFAGRIARPVQGVLAQKFVATAPPPSASLHVAMAGGRDGAGGKLGLVRIGCQRADHHVVFGEVVVPDDEATGRPAIQSSFDLVNQACHDTPPATAAVATPTATLPPGRDYAFQTPPGAGMKPSQVETVLMYWRNDQSGMTMQVHTWFYLLLKDGTFRDGLPPAAFEDVDVAAARRGEPKLWGRWTRSGNRYHLTWPDKSSLDLDNGAVREPARAGEKLQGVYRGFSAYSTGFSVASSEWSVQFGADGRFLKSANSSVVGSAGGIGGVGGTVTSDDRGTTSTMGGSNFATSHSRPNARPVASRTGTYKLDGWTIELDYDNGVVERRPFCATADRKAIWFEGDELTHPLR